MNIGRWSIIIIGCLLFFGIGFKAGEYVEAGGIMPGSSGDPLAAKSYVDKAVAEKIVQLQSQSEDLDAKIAVLQQTVENLEKKVGTADLPTPSEPTKETESKPEPNKETETQQPNNPTTPKPDPVQPDVKPTGKNATITANSANIRKGPGTDYEVIAGLLNGTTVPVLKIEGSWVYVDLGNVKGWVSQNLVNIK